jgi:TetR/AcrR family transcriptional regulator
MPRRPCVSPARILAAAADEFAERGFAGARVDRIARRAKVNKAMLYYHFHSKQGLYRTLLRRVFTDAAARMRAIADAPGPAPAKIDGVIAAFADFIREHEFFAAIMLREVAEGGAHLDRETLGALAGVPRAFFAILQDGIAQGEVRPVHPMVAYFSMLAPIVFYLAAGPIRRELSLHHLTTVKTLTADQFVGELQESARRALAPPGRARSI